MCNTYLRMDGIWQFGHCMRFFAFVEKKRLGRNSLFKLQVDFLCHVHKLVQNKQDWQTGAATSALPMRFCPQLFSKRNVEPPIQRLHYWGDWNLRQSGQKRVLIRRESAAERLFSLMFRNGERISNKDESAHRFAKIWPLDTNLEATLDSDSSRCRLLYKWYDSSSSQIWDMRPWEGMWHRSWIFLSSGYACITSQSVRCWN